VKSLCSQEPSRENENPDVWTVDVVVDVEMDHGGDGGDVLSG
jgi:hypothetical protein